MTIFDDLSPEAKHLLRAAKGGDEATSDDVAASISRYRQSRTAGTSRHGESFTYGRPRRLTPWALVAAAVTATVGAYATVGTSLGLPLPEWWPEFTAWSGDTTSAERSEGARKPNPAKPTPPRDPAFEPVAAAPADTKVAVAMVTDGEASTSHVSPEASAVWDASSSPSDPAPTIPPVRDPTALERPERPAPHKVLPSSSHAKPDATASVAATPNAALTNHANPPSALTREVQTLTAARDALNANDCSAALRHLNTHRVEFPKGVLSEERRALTAICECRTGVGSTSAQAFVAQRPESPLTRRVTKECNLPARP
jgi:hypothetical protein